PRVERVEGVPQRPRRVDSDAPHGTEFLPDDRGHTRGQRSLHDARREQVHMGVDRSCRRDQPFAGHDRGPGADDDIHAVERVRVPGAPDRVDPAVADADRDLADAESGIDDHNVADDQVAGRGDRGGLEVQSVTGGLAEAGQEFRARFLRVVFDLDDQVRVAETDAVALARAVYGHVVAWFEAAHRAPSPASPKAIV